MEALNRTYDKSGLFSFKGLVVFNLLLIAFFDSYAVYASILPVKIFIYALKFFNLFGLIWLCQLNTFKKYLSVLFFFPIWWLYFNESNLGIAFQLFYSGMVPVFTFLLLSDEDQYSVTKKYINLLYYLCLIGLPIYLLINTIGIPPLFSIQRGETGVGRIYENYLFFYWTRGGVKVRFSSVFDEPGVLGTIIPLILFYYRKSMSLSQKLVFIVAGACTLSLFFIITILPVLYFNDSRYISKITALKKVVFFGVIIILGYISLVYFARSTKEDRALAIKVYYRFKWENGWIVGIVNNRDQFISGFDQYYKEFSNFSHLNYYFGMGKDHMKKEFGGSTLSYRVTILERGFLVIVYLFLLLLLIHKWRKYFLFSCVSYGLLILTFYQRPTIYTINYVILIYSGIVLETKRNNKEIANPNPE